MAVTKKTSIFSDSKFPTFVRADQNFDSLRRFIKSYFESLEQEGKASYELNNAEKNADVDTTSAKFLERFYGFLYPDLPHNIAADKRLILKHTKDLYHNKGTPESFRILFRILYNEEINLKYPKDNILRASDGIWNQRVAMQVRISGVAASEVKSLSGHKISTINVNGGVYNTVLGVKELPEPETYELSIDRFKNTRFLVGDQILIAGRVVGTVLPSTTKIIINGPGKNFKLGQIIKLDIGSGTGSLAKITNVSSDGGIRSLKFIRFGSGYTNDFTLTISPSTLGTVTTTGSIDDSVLPSDDGTALLLKNYISGFTEYGVITKTGKNGPALDYFLEDYVVDDYVAANVGYFGSNNVVTPEYPDIDSSAFLTIKVEAVVVSPGYWSDNRGKLNDETMVLQDNDMYQIYSYVIQSSIPQVEYFNTVKNVVHPAGMRMFSDLLIENKFDLSSSIVDPVGLHYKGFVNELVDLQEEIGKELVKPTEDVITDLTDEVYKELITNRYDFTLVDDTEWGDYFSEDYIASDYVGNKPGVLKTLASVKSDPLSVTESINKINSTKMISDAQLIVDTTPRKTPQIKKNDTVTPSDFTTYADPSYFAADYVAPEQNVTISIS